MNFRLVSPDRVTRAVLEGLVAELVSKTGTTLMLDRYNGRIVLRLAEKRLASDSVTVYYAPGSALTEYMSLREMYWLMQGLLNGMDTMESMVYWASLSN